ncbi:MAG: hypothetical protein LWW86_03575 [Micrococcales bacterium]|nr:hypothetical protein [Micrococcales bacterium]
MSEPLSMDDVHDIAMALPEVTLGTSWGEKPTYKVRDKGFIILRGPQKDAVDPETGELMDDVIRIVVPTDEDKQALVESDGPWFTTDHFRSDASVLIRARDLPQLDYIELVEVITDAWARMAPKKLVKQHLG